MPADLKFGMGEKGYMSCMFYTRERYEEIAMTWAERISSELEISGEELPI
jgi:hypothetical protein